MWTRWVRFDDWYITKGSTVNYWIGPALGTLTFHTFLLLVDLLPCIIEFQSMSPLHDLFAALRCVKSAPGSLGTRRFWRFNCFPLRRRQFDFDQANFSGLLGFIKVRRLLLCSLFFHSSLVIYFKGVSSLCTIATVYVWIGLAMLLKSQLLGGVHVVNVRRDGLWLDYQACYLFRWLLEGSLSTVTFAVHFDDLKRLMIVHVDYWLLVDNYFYRFLPIPFRWLTFLRISFRIGAFFLWWSSIKFIHSYPVRQWGWVVGIRGCIFELLTFRTCTIPFRCWQSFLRGKFHIFLRPFKVLVGRGWVGRLVHRLVLCGKDWRFDNLRWIPLFRQVLTLVNFDYILDLLLGDYRLHVFRCECCFEAFSCVFCGNLFMDRGHVVLEDWIPISFGNCSEFRPSGGELWLLYQKIRWIFFPLQLSKGKLSSSTNVHLGRRSWILLFLLYELGLFLVHNMRLLSQIHITDGYRIAISELGSFEWLPARLLDSLDIETRRGRIIESWKVFITVDIEVGWLFHTHFLSSDAAQVRNILLIVNSFIFVMVVKRISCWFDWTELLYLHRHFVRCNNCNLLRGCHLSDVTSLVILSLHCWARLVTRNECCVRQESISTRLRWYVQVHATDIALINYVSNVCLIYWWDWDVFAEVLQVTWSEIRWASCWAQTTFADDLAAWIPHLDKFKRLVTIEAHYCLFLFNSHHDLALIWWVVTLHLRNNVYVSDMVRSTFRIMFRWKSFHIIPVLFLAVHKLTVDSTVSDDSYTGINHIGFLVSWWITFSVFIFLRIRCHRVAILFLLAI